VRASSEALKEGEENQDHRQRAVAAVGVARVLIVDDDEAYRELVTGLLHRAGYVTDEASSGEHALAIAGDERPACVLLDVLLPGVSGYEVCRELRDHYGEALPIIFVSGERPEPADRVAGLLVGGDDYVLKPFDADELIARVRRNIARAASIAASIGARKLGPLELTTRERDVLRLLTEGLEQDAISRELFISPKTVAAHIQRILSKLGVHSRAQAVAFAYRERLLEPPPEWPASPAA
jgi:DNA-binding NarL/FixJ family response regulator